MKKIPPSQLQKTLGEVNVLFSRGYIEAAEKILNELIASFPSHPEVLSRLGTIYLFKDKLSDAIPLIKKSLEVNPYQPDILNNYAVALLNTNQLHEALEVINKAIKIKPEYIDAYYHQGLIYKSLESYDDALNAYQRAIKLMPSHENAILNSAAIYIQLERYQDAISILSNAKLPHPSLGYFYNLGLSHLKLEHFIEAEELFTRVINENPNYNEAWNNLGLALKGLEKFEDALLCIDKAILLSDQYAEAFDNKGLILIELERFDEALVQFKMALNLQPNNYEVYNNMGIAFKELRQFEDALSHFSHALSLMPTYAKAFNNRALIYQELLKFEEALIDFNQAIQINPLYAEAYNNRGLLYKDKSLFDKALQDIKYAFKLDPKLIETNFNLSMIYLMRLEFNEGWPCHEKRKKVSEFVKKTEVLHKIYLDQLPNDHEPILLYSEQGVGDQIIYLSLLHEAIKLPNRILVQIDPRLIPLFKRSFPNVDFYSDKEILDPASYKYHALVGSLPKLFRNSKESFINQRKYFLTTDQNKTAMLRNKLTSKHAFVCGIAWKSKNEKFGHFKTASLNDFLPILKLPSINFVDLQYGYTVDERVRLKNDHDIAITKIDEIDNFNDIDALASLIDACDFIVTISNVTAHIAGALGKKVFLMVPYNKGKIWYWHDGLKISLWYPSIQIFTQTETGEWLKPSSDIKEQLINQYKL